MSFIDLAEKVEGCAEDSAEWSSVRDEIFIRHNNAITVDEYITLLSLHQMLMGYIEAKLPDGISIDEIKALKNQDYKMLLKREYVIGGSVCIDTLYELTQRELEAGRMDPQDELINLAMGAIAGPHYTREQLLRQEENINKIEHNSTFSEKLRERFSQIFR